MTRQRSILAAAGVLVLALSAVYFVTSPRSVDLVMDGWPTRTIGQGITCQVPPSLQPTNAHGIDSMVTVFEDRDMSVSFDFGWYSDPLTSWRDKPQYSERTVKIGGRKAKLVRIRSLDDLDGKPYIAAVAFRNVSGSDGMRNHLSGSVRSATPAGQELAEKIFRTIRFDAKPLNR